MIFNFMFKVHFIFYMNIICICKYNMFAFEKYIADNIGYVNILKESS